MPSRRFAPWDCAIIVPVRLVRLDETKPGHRVSRDVTDARGSLLFKSGTMLTFELIQKLKGWKITHVFIDDTPSQIIDPSQNPVARAMAIDRDLDRIFADCSAHPIMSRLRDAASTYLKGRM